MRSQIIDLLVLRQRISGPRRVEAYARAPLIAFLRDRLVSFPAPPRLMLSGVIDEGPNLEAMCRFTIEGDEQGRSFVVPLSQLSLGRDNQFSNALSRDSRIDYRQ